MSDKEVVIRSLLNCISDEYECSDECQYFKYDGCVYSLMHDAVQLLKNSEPIVKCKDCKYRNDAIRCQLDSEGLKTPDDWFCADGERW